MKRWSTVAVTACLVLVPTASVAEQPLTVADAQAEARAHAPEIAELAARLESAAAIATDAHRALRTDPNLSGQYGNSVTGESERTWAVGVDWTVDISGSWKSRGSSADADRQRIADLREDGLRALDEAVAIAVADLAFAQRQVARAERVVALQQIAASAAQRLLQAGQGNQLDLDAASLDLVAAQTSLAQAHGTLERSRARLGRLLGRASYAGIAVEDPSETGDGPSATDLSRIVDRDPRVRAATAAVQAAQLELATNQRLVWPMPTFGLSLEYFARDVPSGSFIGGPPGLEARWTDLELVGRLSLPLPVFDRRREPRVRSRARVWQAESHLATVRADGLAELADSLADFRSAAQAYRIVSQSTVAIERDYGLLDKALRAGAIDTVFRTLAVRRLVEAGSRVDAVVRDLRVARARWMRRTAGLLQANAEGPR